MRLAWAPIRDVMKSVGAQIVARDAVDLMADYVENKIKSLTADALKLTRHGKRTKLTRDDLDLVIKMK